MSKRRHTRNDEPTPMMDAVLAALIAAGQAGLLMSEIIDRKLCRHPREVVNQMYRLRTRRGCLITSVRVGRDTCYVIDAQPDGSFQPVRRQVLTRSEQMMAMVAEAAEDGMSHAELQERGFSRNMVRVLVWELTRSGQLFGARLRIPGSKESRFYATAAWRDEGLNRSRETVPLATRKPRKPTARQVIVLHKQPPKHARAAGPAASDEPADMSRAVVTPCPSSKDTRYTPQNVEPLFSALRPGAYLQADTWAARAYA